MSDDRLPFERKDGEGYLWRETNSEVIRKGSIQWKGENLYASIIKTEINGEDKYELSISAGLLYINSEEDKRDRHKSPDISGPITFNGEVLKCGGWKNVSESGTDYTKIRLDHKQQTDKPSF
jgi:hypothetical protein